MLEKQRPRPPRLRSSDLFVRRPAPGDPLEDRLAALYASEINVSLKCLWDGGWTVELGGPYRPAARRDFDAGEIGDISSWLHEAVMAQLPKSAYAAAARGEARQH